MARSSSAAQRGTPADDQARNRAFWLRRAGQVRRHVAWAWFLQRTSWPLAILGGLSAAAVLLWRWQTVLREPWPLGWAVAAVAGSGLLAATVALPGLRRQPGTTAALARLDRNLGLQSRLSSAWEGASPWPAPLSRSADGYQIRWSEPLVSLGLAMTVIALAAWLPLAARHPPAPALPRPASHQQLADLLEQARQSGLFDQEDLAHMTQQAAAVSTDLAPEQWHEQAALEAAQALLDQQRAELAAQAQRLAETQPVFQELMNASPDLSPAQREELARQAQQFLDEVTQSEPALDPQLLADLQQAARSARAASQDRTTRPAQARNAAGQAAGPLAGLDPAQAQALQQKFAENRAALEDLLAEMGLAAAGAAGALPGGQPGGEEDGGGSAPLEIAGDGRPRVDRVKGQKALEASGQETGPAGELIDTTSQAPETDDLNLGQRQAGVTAARAVGGDLIRDNQLLPAERLLLADFYAANPAANTAAAAVPAGPGPATPATIPAPSPSTAPPPSPAAHP